MQGHSRFQVLIVTVLLVVSTQTVAQSALSSTEVPVSLVLTLRGNHGADLSEINSGNLILSRGGERAKIAKVLPLQGGGASLELFVMIDDAREISYGMQVEDIRHFILAQPPTMKIGVVYMNIEGPKIAQDLTTDHALAAQAVRTPLARLANGESPYTSLSELIDRWPPSDGHREILMISNGEDATFSGLETDAVNPYADAAISKAQRSGIVVFTIASSNEAVRPIENGPAGILPAENSLTNAAQRSAGLGRFHLEQIAEATGGEFYYYRSAARLSFAPYLADVTDRLESQYVVSFLAKPGKTPILQSVKVRSKLAHIKVASAERVYIPAATPESP